MRESRRKRSSEAGVGTVMNPPRLGACKSRLRFSGRAGLRYTAESTFFATGMQIDSREGRTHMGEFPRFTLNGRPIVLPD